MKTLYGILTSRRSESPEGKSPRRSGAFLLFSLFFLFLAGLAFGQQVAVDKYDYSPGESVRVTGSQWAPNEPVDMRMWRNPISPDTVSFTANADAFGQRHKG